MISVMVLGLRGFPGVQGGIETHAEHLYPLLVQSGVKVDVIVRSPYVENKMKDWEGVTFHRIWAPRITGVEAFLHSILGVLYAGFKRPDILHVHAIGPAIVTPLARLLGLHVVVTHHGPDYDREKWGKTAKFLLKKGERWGMMCSSERIVVSEVIKQLVDRKYNKNSIVIHNGVSKVTFPRTKLVLKELSLIENKYILMVGRMVPEKRQLDLISAFNKADLHGRWKLVLVGAIDSKDSYLNRVISAAEVNKDIVIAGFRAGIALQELYANAGIFVLPSSHEGHPIALLEALSYGNRVIASDIPANLEVGLSNESYFPLGDVDELALLLKKHACEELLLDERRRVSEWVMEKYSWESIASSTLTAYESVMESR